MSKNTKSKSKKNIVSETILTEIVSNTIEIEKEKDEKLNFKIGEEPEKEIKDDDEDDEVDNDKKKKKIEYFAETAEEARAELAKVEALIDQQTKYRKLVFKVYEKLIQKKTKHGKKKVNNLDNQKEATGFVKAKIVPQKFKTFYELCLKGDVNFSTDYSNFDITKQQPRTDITKIIYYYIKAKQLYEKDENDNINKRVIIPDNYLKDLLSIKDGETLGFENFQSYVSRLYINDLENIEKEKEKVALSCN